MLPLDMIVAVAQNGVIGLDGDMPWHVPEDLKHFKATTQGSPVLMGRRTWESLPRRPLPNRVNLVMTRDADLSAEGAIIVHDLADVSQALTTHAPDALNCFVMGGATLYKALYDQARYLWLTRLEITPEGDTWFDLPEHKGFELVSRGPVQHSVSGVSFTIEQWQNPAVDA